MRFMFFPLNGAGRGVEGADFWFFVGGTQKGGEGVWGVIFKGGQPTSEETMQRRTQKVKL